jgi:hypothetical protein
MPWEDGTRLWGMGSRMNRAAVIPAGSERRNSADLWKDVVNSQAAAQPPGGHGSKSNHFFGSFNGFYNSIRSPVARGQHRSPNVCCKRDMAFCPVQCPGRTIFGSSRRRVSAVASMRSWLASRR